MTTPDPEISTSVQAQIAIGETLSGYVEIATGYRRQMTDQGWPEMVAVQLAGEVLQNLQGTFLRVLRSNTFREAGVPNG